MNCSIKQIAGAAGVVALVVFSLLLVPAARADRVMFAEDIHVGPDEIVDNVVCIACSVRIDGVVEQDVVVIAGGLSITGRVDGNVVVVAGGLDSSGPIDGDVVVVAGGAKLGADVGGDTVAVMGGIRLAPGVKLDGDAVAVFGGISGRDHAVIRGQVQEIGGESMAPIAISGILLAIAIFVVAALLFQPILVLVGFALLKEPRLRVLADTAAQRGGLSFLVGIGTSMALFFANIIVALTFPIPFPVFLLFIAITIVGYCGVSYWVGRSILRNSSALAAAFTGAVLITFIQLIPVIGWMVCFVFWNIAIGSTVLSGFGTSTDWLMSRTESDPWAGPAVR